MTESAVLYFKSSRKNIVFYPTCASEAVSIKKILLKGRRFMMKKGMNDWKRILFNWLFAFLGGVVFAVLFHITRGFFNIALGISFLCLGCPMIIQYASKVILDEKNKMDMQILHEIPVCFHKKKVLFAYVEIFIFLGFFSGIVFLLPGGLWILVFPPLGVIAFVILKLTEHTWIAFGWKKRLYWLLSGSIAGIIFLMAVICRSL